MISPINKEKNRDIASSRNLAVSDFLLPVSLTEGSRAIRIHKKLVMADFKGNFEQVLIFKPHWQ